MERELDDIILGLAEQAVVVMTYQDLRETREALESCNVSPFSNQGILAASLATFIQQEITRRGLE